MMMHPQSELENYKLQVELLQAKLHRSEDNRQDLEKKLEQIMKKRNEHEGALRARSQFKYQQFLDEQKKKNERNRKLVEMLEQIDQQGAALSAKSERLKMMKLQYELYFSKLVESCAIKKLKNSAAVSLRSIHRPSKVGATLRFNDETFHKEAYQMPSSSSIINTSPFERIPVPVAIPISNKQNHVQPSLTIGSTQPEFLITLSNNATIPMPSNNNENKNTPPNFRFEYSQFPIGYLPTSIFPMQYNVAQSSFLQQPHHQKTLSEEIHAKQLFEVQGDINQSKPCFESRVELPSFPPSVDVKTKETISTQTNELISEQLVCDNKPKKHECLELKEDEKNGYESKSVKQNGVQVPNENFPAFHQRLKVDKLLNIKLNNSFQQQRIQEMRRIIHEENQPNTIDVCTNKDDDNKYIKYNKEVEQTYKKNHPIPFSLASQELSIDNVTTTLQIKKTEKINETNVRDDKNINDMDENEKNTSSDSSVPFDGKCSIESIGDEALTVIKKPVKIKTEEHILNTAIARSIDPSRDTKQITLFNGTQNIQGESTRASNRTTAIIDGDVGENKENIENRCMNSNTNASISIYHPINFDKKEKVSTENIETSIYGELLLKPENLTFSDAAVLPSDNLRGNGRDDEEIERNCKQTEEYEFSNMKQDSYEQYSLKETDHQQVVSLTTEIEDIEAKQNSVLENFQGSYPFNDNIGSVEEQQYNLQNYTDASAMKMDEGVPNNDYSFTEKEQYLKNNNYALDCQEYNVSQYQTEFEATEYPYDYIHSQCDETNQIQYAPDTYNQEYQQDQYAGYEENVPIKDETSYKGNTEGVYQEVNQGVFENKVEESYTPGLEIPNIDDTRILESLREELHEHSTESQAHPNSGSETSQTKHHPSSILSTEKYSDLVTKKKKRVNFVDSETDESSAQLKHGGISSESDFEFSNN